MGENEPKSVREGGGEGWQAKKKLVRYWERTSPEKG